MHFDSPWMFLLLLLLPALFWPRWRRRPGGALRFSTVKQAGRSGRSLRQRLSFLQWLIRAVVLVLFITALARPQKGLERVRETSEGIAVEMVVDRSSSMAAEMEYEGTRLNRLEVVKRVFERFVLGDDKGLPGRPNDLIGMVVFARYADTVCPLTLAHGALPRFLESVQLVQRRSEDGTAIGDGIALAAARLKTAEEVLQRQTDQQDRDYTIKSKVVILLTDGENNAGRRDPIQAAQLAAEWGIKIYCIGVGGGESTTRVPGMFGDFLLPARRAIDERTLTAIAQATGGLYRRADDAESLAKIYEEIDELERTEIESIRYVDYQELFPAFALAGLLLLLADVLLSGTVFRKIP